jgi:hypothetical protein
MNVIITDGGRAEAGFKGEANDCVTRAVAIITQRPYREVYQELARYEQQVSGVRSARNGISKKAYRKYLADHGFTWIPKMQVGVGTTVHLRRNELPDGRLIVLTSRHLVAVIDGTVYDSHDSTRDGTRAVYGYWVKN